MNAGDRAPSMKRLQDIVSPPEKVKATSLDSEFSAEQKSRRSTEEVAIFFAVYRINLYRANETSSCNFPFSFKCTLALGVAFG